MLMNALGSGRRRRWSAKVRTGCETCRARHLKCDETKPMCRRCNRTGTECRGLGYMTQPRQCQVISRALGRPSPVLTPSYPPSSHRDQQMFNAFCIYTVPHIASGFDHVFWAEDVTRASLSYPVIWHICLALSAIDQQRCFSSDMTVIRRHNHVFALTHYNAAVKKLRELTYQDTLDYTNREVILMANVLFMTLSILREEFGELMTHARHGLQLFYEWQLWDGERPCSSNGRTSPILTKSSVVLLMNRIEGQFLRNGHPRPWHSRTKMIKRPDAPFTSIVDAFLELQPLMSGLLEMFRSGAVYQKTSGRQGPPPDVRLPYRQAIMAWEEKYKCFEKLKQPNGHFSGDETGEDLVLRVWIAGSRVMLHQDPAKVELGWDKFKPLFEKTICFAKKVANGEKTSTHGQLPTGSAQLFSPSICEALLLVADRARDSAIRHEAVSLLASLSRKEGIWDSNLLFEMTKTRMEFEEARITSGNQPGGYDCDCMAGVYICHSHRIVTSTTDFLPDGTVRVYFKTLAHFTSNHPGCLATFKC